ncbi:hypothetical protein PT974_02901 [Cladobotryum mycophilum]|uniref:Uncharacterized protein n=1 Tax=Cladobotryum mycophilum TaxID=491253 RepID=A0ABR0SZD2_9HYPO
MAATPTSILQIIVTDYAETGLFFWVLAMHNSDMLVDQEIFHTKDDLTEGGQSRFVELCPSVVSFGCHTNGLIYDQEHRRVALPFFVDFIHHVLLVDDQPNM